MKKVRINKTIDYRLINGTDIIFHEGETLRYISSFTDEDPNTLQDVEFAVVHKHGSMPFAIFMEDVEIIDGRTD